MITLKKIVLGGIFVISCILPVKSQAQLFFDHIPNPFKQPRQTTDYYGSGDANLDGIVNQTDYDIIQAGTSNDRTDLDGDGTPSTASDLNLLQNYLTNGISLPGWWNELQTKEERIDWVRKMLAIDQTNTFPYIPGVWVSGDYARAIQYNFFGRELLETPGEFELKSRFNIPIYYCSINDTLNVVGHGSNAVLIGEDPLNLIDWMFIEPQFDNLFYTIEPKPDDPFRNIDGHATGAWYLNFLKNGWNSNDVFAEILQYVKLENWSFPVPGTIVQFNYRDSSDFIVESSHSNLVLKRDIVTGVENDIFSPRKFYLQQSYPNPGNGFVRIPYEIPSSTQVSLKVFNLLGQVVETLVDKLQSAGNYSPFFDTSKYPSGVYFYMLQTEGFTETKKLAVVK